MNQTVALGNANYMLSERHEKISDFLFTTFAHDKTHNCTKGRPTQHKSVCEKVCFVFDAADAVRVVVRGKPNTEGKRYCQNKKANHCREYDGDKVLPKNPVQEMYYTAQCCCWNENMAVGR